jgi:hypothetical protein
MIESDNLIQVQAIAIGTGPSFYKWKDTEEQVPRPKLFGCGVVTNYIGGLDYYAYGDSDHFKSLPQKTWHPDCIVYGSTLELVEQAKEKGCTSNYFDPSVLPHGTSSGGMAFSLACSMYDVVGLVGFDGFQKDFKVDDQTYRNFVSRFRDLIQYWKDRGKRLVSLMEESLFNADLERYLKPE